MGSAVLDSLAALAVAVGAVLVVGFVGFFFRRRQYRYLVIALACGLAFLFVSTVFGFFDAAAKHGWEAAQRGHPIVWDYSGPGLILLLPLMWVEFGIAGAVRFSQKKLRGRWGIVLLIAIFTALLGVVLFLTGLIVGGPITWILAEKAVGQRQCPSCFGYSDERAKVCRHCREALPSIARTTATYSW